MIKISLLISLIVMLSLANGSEYAFGTKVLLNDTDIGRPLYDMPAGPIIGFWGTGAHAYGKDDVVYLHIPKDERETEPLVNENDVRLTSFQENPAGSKVKSQDSDMNKQLTILPVTINYLNLSSGQEYYLEAPIYLHQLRFDYNSENTNPKQIVNNAAVSHGNGEAATDTGGVYQERLPYLGGQNPFVRVNYIAFTDGYKLLILDKIINSTPEVIGKWQGFDVEVIHGTDNDYYHVLNTWLVKITPINMSANKSLDNHVNSNEKPKNVAASPANNLVSINDIRLSSNGNLMAGTKVMNSDADQNKTFLIPPLLSFSDQATDTAKIMYFDSNSNGIYDSSDDIYLDFPDNASVSSVIVNDLRLSAPSLAKP